MNIFIVDKDPVVAARMLCNQHVVKMITESVQMLSTCHRVLDGVMTKQPSNSGKRVVPRYQLPDYRDKVLYHAVHFNHPCNIWIRECKEHYNWLLSHVKALCEEYTLRYSKHHACEPMVEFIQKCGPPNNIGNKEYVIWTHEPDNEHLGKFVEDRIRVDYLPMEFVQAMPDQYKDKDPVVAYRNFYVGSKSKFAKWKYRNPPMWYLLATSPPRWRTNATSKSVRSVSALRSNQKSLSDNLRLLQV